MAFVNFCMENAQYNKNTSFLSDFLKEFLFIYSWDRIVAEQFVLKDTDENQALMKRLATLARNV